MQNATLPAGMSVFERGWLSSNNILFVGDAAATLVDTGYATHAEQTLALVRAALGGRRLDQVVNTHLHSDHCGGNAALQAAYPCLRTWIPAAEADAVRHWDEEALTYAPTGQTCPRFVHSDVLIAGKELELGGRAWQVHAAPGHDPHSLILFEPSSRTLISADALWESGFGVVFPEIEGESAFAEVAATLSLIDSLEPALVIPGHGPVFTDVSFALARARGRLDAFVANPAKHAIHAVKVLLKFKLLEWRRVALEDLLAWSQRTHYFQMLHARWASALDFRAWVIRLVEDLERSGALHRDGDMIVDA